MKKVKASKLEGRLAYSLFFITFFVNLIVLLCTFFLFQLAIVQYVSNDVAYVFITIFLLLFIFLDTVASRYLIKQFRGRLTSIVFNNLSNIGALVSALIIFIVYFINSITSVDDVVFSSTEYIILLIPLGLIWFFYLMVGTTVKKSYALLTDHASIIKFSKNERYLLIIFLLLAAILIDFTNILQLENIILVLIVMVTFSIFSILLNIAFSNEVIIYFTKQKSNFERDKSQKAYEIDPYVFEKSLTDAFKSMNAEEMKSVLHLLRSKGAVNIKAQLAEIKEQTKQEDLKEIISQTEQYFKEYEDRYDRIDNIFEYIEQSSDRQFLKIIARSQIGNADKNLLIKLLNDNRIEVQKEAIYAAGHYDEINFISLLIDFLKVPELSIYAQQALRNIGTKALKYIEIEFSKQHNSSLFIESSFQVIVGIEDEEAERILFSALNNINKNIQLIALKNILQYKAVVDDSKRGYFVQVFEHLVLLYINNYHMLRFLSRESETFFLLKNALRRETEEILDMVEQILTLYYPSGVIKGIFYFFENKSQENYLVSNQLVDSTFQSNLVVYSKLKAMLSPTDDRLLEILEEESPSSRLNRKYKSEEEIIRTLLDRDYDRLNHWTKACAIDALQYIFSDDIPYDLAAEFLNQDSLLSETAAISIYKNQPEFYSIFLNRLSKDSAAKLDYKIRSNLEYANDKLVSEDNFLIFEKIQFIASIPILKDLTLYDIITFEPYFKEKVFTDDVVQLSVRKEENRGLWIVESDFIEISFDGRNFKKMSKRSIIDLSRSTGVIENIIIKLEHKTRFLYVENAIIHNILPQMNEIISDQNEEISEISANLQVGDISTIRVA